MSLRALRNGLNTAVKTTVYRQISQTMGGYLVSIDDDIQDKKCYNIVDRMTVCDAPFIKGESL